MTDAMAPPRRILAVLEQGEEQIALTSAMALADRSGAEVACLACVEPPQNLGMVARLTGRDADRLMTDLCAQRRAEMTARIDALRAGRPMALHVTTGKTYIEVVRHVIATGADFVIKSAEPLTGLHGVLFASTDQHLLRKCPCPVWLQTKDADPTPKTVIAAVDVDMSDAHEPDTLFTLNRRVIETARRIAAPGGAPVTVLHAWEAIGEGMVWAFSGDANARTSADSYVNAVLEARHAAMDRLLQGMTAPRPGGDAALVARLERGAPERVIEQQCRALGADVIVMGTVARTGLSGVFIGNTAENIINSLECSVVAVKPEGFVSPLDMRTRDSAP